jgi:hypothetical protein
MLSVLLILVLPIYTALAFYFLRVVLRSRKKEFSCGARLGLVLLGANLAILLLLFCLGDALGRFLLSVMVLYCGLTGWIFGGLHPLESERDS